MLAVTVTGGSAKIAGTVTGDLVVFGGSAKVIEGARIIGNVAVMGGSVKVASGARIDGNVGAMGGSVKTEDGAIVGGKIIDDDREGEIDVRIDKGGVHPSVTGEGRPITRGERLADAAHSFGRKVTAMSFLFVFGCVLLALATGLLGSVLFLVGSSLPWIGGLVTVAVTMIAVGTLVTTRLAGALRKKPTGMGLV